MYTDTLNSNVLVQYLLVIYSNCARISLSSLDLSSSSESEIQIPESDKLTHVSSRRFGGAPPQMSQLLSSCEHSLGFSSNQCCSTDLRSHPDVQIGVCLSPNQRNYSFANYKISVNQDCVKIDQRKNPRIRRYLGVSLVIRAIFLTPSS